MSAHVTALWRAQPGALMLLGRAAGPLPKAGSVRVAKIAGAAGVFRAEFWQLQGEPGYAFLAAIRIPHLADRADTAELVLRGARGADRDLCLALVGASGEPAFGKQVAEASGAHAARVARFMLDMMRSDDGSDMRQPSAMLEAFLTHAARADGCVELIMQVPQKCVLLQGWGTRSVEPVDVLLPGSSLLRHQARSGDFPRSDVPAPSAGIVLMLPPEVIDGYLSLERVFLLTGDDLLCRTVVEPRVLDVDASVGQIRHLLPPAELPRAAASAAPRHVAALVRGTGHAQRLRSARPGRVGHGRRRHGRGRLFVWLGVRSSVSNCRASSLRRRRRHALGRNLGASAARGRFGGVPRRPGLPISTRP